MSRRINQDDLRENSDEIVHALSRGQGFTVIHDGAPIGELRPYQRQFVSRSTLVEVLSGAPTIDADQFRSDLDHILDQGDEPRI